MAEEETAGLAEGNATAQLYSFAAADPEENPFEDELSEEQIDRHFYFNDDILTWAERIDSRIQEMQRRDLIGENGLPIPTRDDSLGEGDNGLPRFPRTITREAEIAGFEAEIRNFEERILAELVIVRDEYRDKAAALERRRELFTQDYEMYLGQIQRMSEENVRYSEMGLPPPNSEAAMTNVNGSTYVHIRSYESTYGDYRLLEEGFSITTAREAFMNFVWGGATLVAVEIITGGVAKFVIIGARSLTVVAGATRVGQVSARIAGQAAAIMAARYNALSNAAKIRLDRLRRTKRVDEPERPSDNGVADDAVAEDVPVTCVMCP